MHQLLRRLHLFTGLVLLVFLLMYFVSGYVMIHADWFRRSDPVTTTRTEPLSLPGALDDAATSRYLQERFGLRGKRNAATHRKDGSVQFNFVRPGTTFEAVVTPERSRVTITRKEFDLVGLANGMHRLRGYGGGGVYNFWSLLYDLASGALILFALTGILLWYQSTTRRLPGFLCLAGSFGFSAAMILYFMLRP